MEGGVKGLRAINLNRSFKGNERPSVQNLEDCWQPKAVLCDKKIDFPLKSFSF